MKFSIMLLMPVRGGDAGPVLVATGRRVELAEALGFHRAWLTENHFSDWGACANPLLFAGHLAARTSTIRIGTAVLVLPRYHPLALAEEIAMVDQLSGGRLDVGIGRGYRPAMLKPFGVAPERTQQRFLEVHDGMLRAWANDRPRPRVLQRPHPPFFIATSHGDDMLRLTAECGYGLLLASTGDRLRQNVDAWRAAAHDRTPGPCVLSRAIHLADSTTVALDRTAEATAWYLQQASELRGGGPSRAPLDPTLDGFCLYGDARTTIEKLRALQAQGVDEIACTFDLGGIPERLVVESMTRFAAEVMPAFGDAHEHAEVAVA